MKTTYVCEITGESFDNAEECAAHEQAYRDRSETFKKNVELAIDEIEKNHGVSVIRDTVRADDTVRLGYYDELELVTYVNFTYVKDGELLEFAYHSDNDGYETEMWYGDKSVSNIVQLFATRDDATPNLDLVGESFIDSDGNVSINGIELVELFTLLEGRQLCISIDDENLVGIDFSGLEVCDGMLRIDEDGVMDRLRSAYALNHSK